MRARPALRIVRGGRESMIRKTTLLAVALALVTVGGPVLGQAQVERDRAQVQRDKERVRAEKRKLKRDKRKLREDRRRAKEAKQQAKK